MITEWIKVLPPADQAVLRTSFENEETRMVESRDGNWVGVHFTEPPEGFVILQQEGYFSLMRKSDEDRRIPAPGSEYDSLQGENVP